MKRAFALLFLLVTLPALACSAPARLLGRLRPSATPTSTATLASSPTPQPSLTPEPSIGPVSLVEKRVEESSSTDAYSIEANFPYLPVVVSGAPTFNDAMAKFEAAALDEFKRNAAQANSIPVEANDSFLQTRTDVLYNQRGLLSLRLWVDYYMKGAAHPGSFAATFTYDLLSEKMLALDDLFLAGKDYLPALAQFCQAEIAGRDPAFSPEGAAPDPANYRNWNLTPTGLLITFDEYQVAPYAAGPQEVEVPFNELEGLKDPEGPLGRVVKEYQ